MLQCVNCFRNVFNASKTLSSQNNKNKNHHKNYKKKIKIKKRKMSNIYASLTFLFIVFVLCLACIFVKKKYPDLFTISIRNNDVPTVGDSTSSTTAQAQDEEDNNEVSLTEKIQKLSTEKRYQYYNEVFNKTGNQIELSSNQIITGNNKNNNGGSKTKVDIENNDEEPSIYLSLDSVLNSMRRKSSIILKNAFQTKNDAAAAAAADCSRKEDNDKQTKRSSFLVLSSTKTRNGNNRNNTVSGNCVICFENFKEGDTIVYNSETKDCPHIYHKECMVDYFVSRNIFRKEVKKGEEANPSCPTCRQTFCKLTSLIDDATESSIGSNESDPSSSSSLSFENNPDSNL
jgi:hypothetical protein